MAQYNLLPRNGPIFQSKVYKWLRDAVGKCEELVAIGSLHVAWKALIPSKASNNFGGISWSREEKNSIVPKCAFRLQN